MNNLTQTALEWWGNLADISIQMPSKSHLCKLYHGDMRIHKSLKPSEIVDIYKSEHPHLITSAEQLDELMDDIFSQPLKKS